MSEDERQVAELHDLFDKRQIDLFDALDKLAGLRITGQTRIEVPQLVVVGSQSSGKSSTLEALVRFKFPVHEQLCTRFPIRLILRRSEREEIHTSVEMKSQQMDEGEVQKSFDDINKSNSPSDKPDVLVKNACDALSTSDSFSENVMVIKKSGPDLPLVTLLDLPGVFQAHGATQNEASKKKVQDMVTGYILSKRTVVMLIVTAHETYYNDSVISLFQDLQKEDKGLQKRAIGVITKPDKSDDHEETLKLINGEHDFSDMTLGWHIVRNQSKNERGKSLSLDERNQNENKYFESSSWPSASQQRKGIACLRSALKDVLWTHTKTELPDLISEVESKISNINRRLEISNKSRATTGHRRKYLSEIAEKFENLIRQAVQGTYEDKLCTEFHAVGESCPNCHPFFSPLRDGSEESQAPKLRANIRALSKAFAMTMHKYGKTQIIQDEDVNNSTFSKSDTQSPIKSPSNHSQAQPPNQLRAGNFLSEEVLRKYYCYKESARTHQKDYLRSVHEDIERNRGREPLGEASEALYRGLFLWQSENWETIATQHLRAVWEATEKLVELALNSACEDADVLQALREKIINPNLVGVQKSAYRTLKDLLNCRRWGSTGFHDGYFHIMQEDIVEKTHGLTERLNSFPYTCLDIPGNTREYFVQLLDHALGSLVALPVAGFQLNDFIARFTLQTIEAKLPKSEIAKSDSNKLNGKDKPSKASKVTNVKKGITDSINHSYENNDCPERAADHVEAYYQINMLSFVGYVNSLVIESGILRKLETDIFSQREVREATEEAVDDIAKERPTDAEKRKEDEETLKSLNEILTTLVAAKDKQ